MGELEAFLKPIVYGGELDACGALADWLEEHADARGSLLRKRWRRWIAERARAEESDKREAARIKDIILTDFAHWSVVGLTVEIDHGGALRADESLRRYIRHKFPESWPTLHDDA